MVLICEQKGYSLYKRLELLPSGWFIPLPMGISDPSGRLYVMVGSGPFLPIPVNIQQKTYKIPVF